MIPPPDKAAVRTQGKARTMIGRVAASRVMRDTSLVAIGQSLFKGTLYLASIALSRSLTVDQFATFGYFSVTSRFLSIFFAAGLTIAATKAFADASADQRDADRTAAVVFLLISAALLGTALSPLYLPIVDDEEIRLDGGWLIVGAAAQGAYAVGLAAMFGASAFRRLLVPMAIGSAALLLGAAVSARTGEVTPALVGYVASFLAPALLFGAGLYRRGPLRLLLPSKAALATVVRTALPTLAIGTISAGVVWLVMRVLFDHAESVVEFNKLVIGMQWFVLVLFLPNALGNALFPRFLHGAREGRLDVRLAGGIALSAFAAIGVLAILALLLTPLLSELYGQHYQFTRAFVFAIVAAAALAGPVTMLSYPVIAAFGAGRWLLVNLVLLATVVGLLAIRPPQTALEAALVLCGGQAAVLLAALLTLSRIPRAGRG